MRRSCSEFGMNMFFFITLNWLELRIIVLVFMVNIKFKLSLTFDSYGYGSNKIVHVLILLPLLIIYQ